MVTNSIFNSRKHLCCINQGNNNYWNQVWFRFLNISMCFVWFKKQNHPKGITKAKKWLHRTNYTWEIIYNLTRWVSHVSKKFWILFFQFLIVYVQKYNWTLIIKQSGTYMYQCKGCSFSEWFILSSINPIYIILSDQKIAPLCIQNNLGKIWCRSLD